MSKSYSRIARAITQQPWFILPEKLEAICELIQLKSEGLQLQDREINAAIAAAAPGQRNSGAVAVLPLYGVISQRVNLMTEYSGGTSIDKFSTAFRQLVSDSSIRAIVLDVDSPGGVVYGVDELSQEIFKARGLKPIVAVANSVAASAAYYVASAADELIVTPSGEVGSIGTVMIHEDYSKALEQQGVQVRIISAGKYKTEGNPYQPMTDEAVSAFQGRVDEYYDAFVRAVARNRGTSAAAVKRDYGQGRMLGAQAALEAGMVDRIATLDATIRRMGGVGESRKMKAEDDIPEVITEESIPAIEAAEQIPAEPIQSDDWRQFNLRKRIELG